MKPRLLELLACPACGADLRMEEARLDGDEIIEATLPCTGCERRYPVRRGVPRFTEVDSRGDTDTADAFGYQWNRYHELAPAYRKQFLDWIAPVDAEFFRGKTVLECGCGKGRHTALAAEFGARDVVAIDLSSAVDAAFQNTRSYPHAHIVQADLNHPPVRRVFDYAFSVGVLHHLPEPEIGFRAMVGRVVDGGAVSAWVYGREGNGWIVHLVSPVREHVTSRLPRRALAVLSNAATVPLFAVTRLVYRPARKWKWGARLPYAPYLQYISDLGFGEQRTIVFDHLVAPIAYYLQRDEFAAWFERMGLTEIRIEAHNANSWRGFARVPRAS